MLSVNKLTNCGQCKVNFFAGYSLIVDHNTSKLKGFGKCRGGLYYLMNEDMKSIVSYLTKLTSPSGMHAAKLPVNVTHGCMETKKLSEIMMWHLRLGHTPMQKLSIMGLNIKPNHNSQTQIVCTTCSMGKLTKPPFPSSQSHASNPFELLHIDIWGPYKVQTRSHHRFFLTVVDDHTRSTWVTLLQHKSEAYDALARFVKTAATQFNCKVKVVRSDNALEFKGNQCRQLYEKFGIIHQTTCVNTAQ